MKDIPVIYAAQHPTTKRWYVDTDKSTVRRVAHDFGAEVLTVDVPALMALVNAVSLALPPIDCWADESLQEAANTLRTALEAIL